MRYVTVSQMLTAHAHKLAIMPAPLANQYRQVRKADLLEHADLIGVKVCQMGEMGPFKAVYTDNLDGTELTVTRYGRTPADAAALVLAEIQSAPRGAPVREAWCVSPWLASRLFARGEAVVTLPDGLAVWGRVESGDPRTDWALNDIFEALLRANGALGFFGYRTKNDAA